MSSRRNLLGDLLQAAYDNPPSNDPLSDSPSNSLNLTPEESNEPIMAQPPQFFTLTAGQLQDLVRGIIPPAPVRPQPKPDKSDFGGIPEFQGEPELLSQFIERSEELIEHFFDEANPESYQNKVIINNIRAKIKGKAATGIYNSPLNSWGEIRAALIANFSDKRDEEHLILELGKVRQGQNENPFDFHARVNKLFTLLISKLKNATDEYTHTTMKLMERVALRGFLMGLHEDIGRLLITKGPRDLNDAIHMLTNDYQFPMLRKKYLEKKPSHQGPSTSESKPNNYQKSNYPQRKYPPQPAKTQQPSGPPKKPNYPANQNAKPTQPSSSQPFIPYHLRTKDTMSYQTTLNHELNQEDNDPDTSYEEPEIQEDENHFLEETEEDENLT